MKKMKWKRLAAFVLAALLFAGAVPFTMPVQTYASEVAVYSDKIQRGKTGKSLISKTQRLPLTPAAVKSGMRMRKTGSMAILSRLR